jgi:hypothetical protein
MSSEPPLEKVVAGVVRTLRLKVKSEAYPWLNAAAMEVNAVWNHANEVSARAGCPLPCARSSFRRQLRRRAKHLADARLRTSALTAAA